MARPSIPPEATSSLHVRLAPSELKRLRVLAATLDTSMLALARDAILALTAAHRAEEPPPEDSPHWRGEATLPAPPPAEGEGEAA